MRVVLNRTLKNEITNNIKSKFSARVQKAAEKIKTVQISNAMINLLFTPKQQDAIKQLPPDLLPTQTNMYFLYNGEKFELVFQKAEVLPSTYRSHYNPGRLDLSANPELAAPFDEFITTKKEIHKERDLFLTKVSEMMSQVATLNQLVQVWPSVVEFCDEDTRERLNRKIVRFKPETVEVDDETKLAIAKMRMSQS